MNRASAFGRGAWADRQNALTAISYDIYKTKPESVDLDEVTLDDNRNFTLFTPLPDTHMWASFGHLGGYSSAYYTYLFDKVISEDFFVQFDHKNLLAGDAPMKYRRVVLEPAAGYESVSALAGRRIRGWEPNCGGSVIAFRKDYLNELVGNSQIQAPEIFMQP